MDDFSYLSEFDIIQFSMICLWFKYNSKIQNKFNIYYNGQEVLSADFDLNVGSND